MNYGYADLSTGAEVPLFRDGNAERLALQLYVYVATLGSHGPALRNLDVLEIGSGRGGGAAFIADHFNPGTMKALDVSSSATPLAQKRYQKDNALEYVQGGAEKLHFGERRFDIVLNVESAHCYGPMPRFLSEVHRVLRPNGELLFADFVSKRNGAIDRLHMIFHKSPRRLVKGEDITENVVRALELDETRKRDMLDRRVIGPFKTFARGAYAMEGTAMRRELESGQTVYLAAVLHKGK